MLERLTTPKGRQRLYGIAVVAIALLVTYKIVEPEHAPLWLDLAANILGLGVPTAAAGTANLVVRDQRRNGTLDD
ncbi:MAG: phage holin [Mycobacterium sp.]